MKARIRSANGCCGIEFSHGAAQRNENRMLRLAGIHPIQFVPPPFEQAQTFFRIADFVGQIVGPAAIGVDIVEILVQMFGQQETDDMEIFVVMGGEPAGVLFGFGCRPRARAGFGAGDEIAGQTESRSWNDGGLESTAAFHETEQHLGETLRAVLRPARSPLRPRRRFR